MKQRRKGDSWDRNARSIDLLILGGRSIDSFILTSAFIFRGCKILSTCSMVFPRLHSITIISVFPYIPFLYRRAPNLKRFLYPFKLASLSKKNVLNYQLKNEINQANYNKRISNWQPFMKRFKFEMKFWFIRCHSQFAIFNIF